MLSTWDSGARNSTCRGNIIWCDALMVCRYELLGQRLAGAGALALPGAAGAASDPACLENLLETLLQLLITIHPLLLMPSTPFHIALPLCQVVPLCASHPLICDGCVVHSAVQCLHPWPAHPSA